MKNTKNKYWLVFHSRANEAVSAEEKYDAFIKRIKDLPAPWGLGNRPAPPPPTFGRLNSASIGLTKFFGDGVTRAMMTFVYRRMLDDKGSSDDLLNITFSPAKVDLHYLIYTVIPVYIEAFNAYRVEYFDEQLINSTWKSYEEQGRTVLTAKSKEHINPRFAVERVDVVNFFDELLCRRAFNLSPGEVLLRLQETIEDGQLLQDGVYIVGSSKILEMNDSQKLCQNMKTVLSETK